ncbi:MAG: DNA primase [Candidatus Obscuribacterales bacterium]|nr:DNA primase [Candidatus Obscuribacterales bacterium]
MKGVTSDVISEVRHRAKLLDIVSEVVVLKRAGKDYKGLCPFHGEKSPSFFVNPEKGIFKCFGCGEGGDVFAFVQKIKRLDFLDTVRELANKTGVQLVETAVDQGEYDRRSQLMMLHQQAAEYYSRLLLDPEGGAAARAYLEQRGIDEETITRFKLGLAPVAWDGLLRYLTEANSISPETLVEAGLVRRKPETNSFYDLFRNRLIVPIQDEQGRVIAFGGRTLGDDQIKYLNSPESPIYTKGEHLFALPQAKDSIRDRDGVIVVEGYFDAITAHQHGFTNTVATLGTALTERQGKLLVRFTDRRRVYLCFDADAAGQRAVDRGMETLNHIAEGIGIEMRVISVPGGKDPDECLRSQDENAGVMGFARAINSAPLLIDYQLERAVVEIDLASHGGRIEGAKLIVPVLASIKNAVARGEYIQQWAMRLGIREENLSAEVSTYMRQKRFGSPQMHKPQAQSQSAKNAPKPGYYQAELQLLSLYLLSRQDYETMRVKLSSDRLMDPVHQRIKETLEGMGHFVTVEDFWQNLQDRLSPDMEANQRLSDLSSKVDEIKRQNLPTEVILKEARSRLLQWRLKEGIERRAVKMRQRPGEEEEVRLQSTISQLKRLQDQIPLGSMNDEELEAVKQKIDALLVETTA